MRIVKRTPAKKPVASTTEPVVTATVVTIASIPDPAYEKIYIHRSVKGVHDFVILQSALDAGRNVLVMGPTGSAKTTLFMAFAASRRKRFYAIPSNVSIDPSQLFGKFIPPSEENDEWTWVDGGVTDIVRNGGILLINEINFLPDRISTVIFSLLDRRREITLLDHRGETVRAHRPKCWCDLPSHECRDKWVLIAGDMNEGYAGTRELNAAFRNRFPIQIEWAYDPEVEKELIGSAVLMDIAGRIRARTHEFETPVSTNMLIELEEIARELGLEFAIQNFVTHFLPDERQAITDVFRVARMNLEADFEKLKPESVSASAPVPTASGWTPGPDDDISALESVDWVDALELL